MRTSRLAVCITVAFLIPVQASQAECELDLGGPVLPAYLCAEKRAASAATQLDAELKATLASLPKDKAQPGLPLVTRRELLATQEKWRSYAKAHCAFVSRVPGEPGDWHITVIYENACLARLSTERVAQLRAWRACFEHGGGECLP
jgi:uncharacterized protein YecT (DUF1311 family)